MSQTFMLNRSLRHTALALALTALLGSAPAHAQIVSTLPTDATFATWVQQHPLWRAQTAQSQAEQQQAEQRRAGPHEWTPSLMVGRRQAAAEATTPSTREREWEATLERGIRLPGKQLAAEQASQQQQNLSSQRLQQTWRQLALQALTQYSDWLREARLTTLWQAQVNLLTRETQATDKRQRLGDASRVDSAQMQAALSQAQWQAQAAQQRQEARGRQLQSQFPGWPLTMPTASQQPPTDALDVPAVTDAQVANDPEWRAAQLEADQALTLASLDQREQTPDPTVGLKLAQSRNSAEKMLGVTLSWPIGGAARSHAAQASAAQAEAARQRAEWARTQAQQGYTQARQNVTDSLQRWQLAHAAWQQLQDVALSLEKGFRLGEGSLNELLQARRLANDQAQVAAQAEVDHLLARWTWQVMTGTLWAPSSAL
ncbi:TolC family protein [Aquabacterium sp.]|uniref:TolC family protein n=1 Tax=Aquabacterium sp. TaxID=1872578 RepID=UPI003B7325E7